MLHDTLWNENAELVRRCLEHPFVQGLADGTLDRDALPVICGTVNSKEHLLKKSGLVSENLATTASILFIIDGRRLLAFTRAISVDF